MLSVIEKVIFLQNVDVFSGVSTGELSYIAAIAEEESFLEQDVIYSENDPADALYRVLDGRVSLHRGAEEIISSGPSEAVGSWALFDEEPRVTTATCREKTRLLRIGREDFYELLSDHAPITQGVFKALVTKLRTLLEKVDTEHNIRPGTADEA